MTHLAHRHRMGLDRPNYTLKHLGYLLLACAALSAWIGWRQ